MIRPFLLLILLLTSLPAAAQNMKILPMPEVIPDHQVQRIRIITQAELELGALPDHPKITWLGYSNVRIRNNARQEMQTENRIEFIATAPGLLEIPPIPVVLENKEFFIRLDDMRVVKNTASQTDTKLEVYWNEQLEIPKQVHLGEAVEVKFVQSVRRPERRSSVGPYFSAPSNRVTGGQWHAFTRAPARKPFPSDYFLSTTPDILSDSRPQNFFSFRRDPYNSRDTYRESQILDQDEGYYLRTYQARLYFTKIGTTSGHLSATIGTSGSRSKLRTHVLPFEIEVLPIPALPNEQAFDTGLVGDWHMVSRIRPRQAQEAKPLTITIAIEGHGNPDLRNSFDLSADGFPSVKSEFQPNVAHNYTRWEGLFQQTLLPTGKVGTLPAITLASFDTVGDQWRYHEITPSIILPGFTDAASTFTPRRELGKSVTRPVLLNLPTLTFGAFALAPLLPFFFGFLKKRREARDPEAEERERLYKKIMADFKAGRGTPEAIDDQLLPILRTHLKLPTGATTREVADALAHPDQNHPDLAASLRTHAESSFSATSATVDFKALASQLAKLSLLILFTLTFSNLRALSLDEANAFHAEGKHSQAITGYQSLIDEDPNRASLYFNLSQTHLAAGEPARALAACHTALLLKPLDGKTHELMTSIRERMGDLTVGRNRFFSLRPDQWIIAAAAIWFLAFLYLAFRKLRPLPLWPGIILIILSLVFLGTAAWRQNHDYADEQFMVIADELPREVTAGTPDWNFPALRAGQIVRVAEKNATHARVATSDSSFWLPIRELQQVW